MRSRKLKLPPLLLERQALRTHPDPLGSNLKMFVLTILSLYAQKSLYSPLGAKRTIPLLRPQMGQIIPASRADPRTLAERAHPPFLLPQFVLLAMSVPPQTVLHLELESGLKVLLEIITHLIRADRGLTNTDRTSVPRKKFLLSPPLAKSLEKACSNLLQARLLPESSPGKVLLR